MGNSLHLGASQGRFTDVFLADWMPMDYNDGYDYSRQEFHSNWNGPLPSPDADPAENVPFLVRYGVCMDFLWLKRKPAVWYREIALEVEVCCSCRAIPCAKLSSFFGCATAKCIGLVTFRAAKTLRTVSEEMSFALFALYLLVELTWILGETINPPKVLHLRKSLVNACFRQSDKYQFYVGESVLWEDKKV